jgi:hypothetical protein
MLQLQRSQSVGVGRSAACSSSAFLRPVQHSSSAGSSISAALHVGLPRPSITNTNARGVCYSQLWSFYPRICAEVRPVHPHTSKQGGGYSCGKLHLLTTRMWRVIFWLAYPAIRVPQLCAAANQSLQGVTHRGSSQCHPSSLLYCPGCPADRLKSLYCRAMQLEVGFFSGQPGTPPHREWQLTGLGGGGPLWRGGHRGLLGVGWGRGGGGTRGRGGVGRRGWPLVCGAHVGGWLLQRSAWHTTTL